MSSTGHIPPSNPYHIARAYGVNPPARAAASGPAAPAARVSGANPSASKLPTPAQRLVGARVPGRVDFSGSQPAPTSGALPLYAHPADKNAAATAVQLGRALDVQG